MNYRQVTLKKGNIQQVTWLPEEFAILGKILQLREEEWSNGWEVIRVGTNKVDEKHVPNSHKDIKGHRKMTGDSLPKNVTN